MIVYYLHVVPPFWSIYVFVTLMLVGVWLGLLWVLFYFFDHYIQSSTMAMGDLNACPALPPDRH